MSGYVVLETAAWLDILRDYGGKERLLYLQNKPLTDAIVIRKSDIFASSVLYEYANMLRTAVEVADDLLGMPAEDRPDKAAKLMELADAMYEHAAEAEERYKGELPV